MGDIMQNIFKKLEENIKKSKRTRKMIILIFCIVLLFFIYTLTNYTDLIGVYNTQKDVSQKLKNMDVALGGQAVGIKLLAEGVLVVSIDRDDIVNIQVGDVILSVNGIKIDTNAELSNYVRISNGSPLQLQIERNGLKYMTTVTPIKDDISGEYKLGLWVKDSSAGVGTVTFYDKKNLNFAALGHGVTETKDNVVLPIESGGITQTKIYSLKKGVSRDPGEIRGTLTTQLIGQIYKNTEKGIYGKIENDDMIKNLQSIEILPKSKVKEKAAKIYCTLDDNVVESFDIVIEKVLLTSKGNKNMIIRVTDEKLKEKTGGIIQGMSGSPIVQDGKLVGAVTHVFLNDPLRGYGVFIEDMIEDVSNM